MLPEPPLVIPFLPNVELGGALPVAPVRIASWTTTTTAGPSKRLAVAGTDNTVWILTSSLSAPQHLPELCLPDAESRSRRPSSSRHVSSASTSTFIGNRPRASSSASILTNTSLRRVLSPTIASASVSSATVTAAAPDAHVPRGSASEHADLIQQLRDQADTLEDRSSLGVGLAGFARRGVSGVTPPKEETRTDGAASPRSVASSESRGLSATISGMMGRGGDEEAVKKDLRDKIDEMAVEQEMIREEAEDEREAEDMKIVEHAPRPLATPTPSDTPRSELTQPPMRIVLPEPGRGTIVDLAVLEEVGELVVLRDVGLLDVLNLSNLQLTKHISLDHAAPPPSAGGPSRLPKLAPSWLWQRVHLAAREEGALVIANGVPWPSPWPSPNGEVTRVSMLALPEHDCVANLELPGLGDIGVTSNSEASYLLHATPTSLMSYAIEFPHTPPSSRSSTPAPRSNSVSASGSPHLLPASGRRYGALANVRSASGNSSHETKQSGLAKFLAARRITSKKQDEAVQSAAGVKQGIEVQRDGGGHWFSVRLQDSGQGVGLGDGHVEMFDFDGKKLSVRGSIAVPNGAVKDVAFSANWNDIVVVTDSDTIIVFGQDSGSKQKWSQRKLFSGYEACLGAETVHAVEEQAITNIELGSLKRQVEVETTKPVAGDHICPMGASKLFVASPDGELGMCASTEYLHKRGPKDKRLTYPLDATITYSTLVKADNATGGRFLVMGDADGAVHIWDAQTLKLRGSWTLFDDHVRSATLLDMEEAGSLKGTLLCTAACGTVGIISLRDMEQLYLIPAARAPLTRIYVGGEVILLAYEIQKARVWNVVTGEFRRSTGLDSADDMLNSKGWAEVRFQAAPPLDSPVSKVVGPLPFGADLGRLLQLDLRELGKWLQANRDSSPLPALRGLLSVFLTFGINPDIDEMCTTHLGITPPPFPVAIGLEGPHGTATVAYTFPEAAWRVSPTVTGLRQLAIVSLLRPFMDAPEYDRYATDVVAFYSASLPEDAAEADLELFAAFYLDSASDVHQAARMLFGARLSRMPNEDIERMVYTQQSLLPSAVPPDQRMSEASARALTMVGGMALHRFSCMNPRALKSVAQSIAIYLNDSTCTHIDLAIELCSKGFPTWQSYVDPMDLLRRLFFLSTQRDLGPNITAQARLAVLHAATTNAPLFMSTLSMDIMDAKTVEDRTSIMRLCVYLARKRPALLEHGLPRIAEAVVKSIDPNIGKMRDHVWEAATEILRELVQAFSSIDFSSTTQRLAVGTQEGAVIMYDLKTASRLYVLEPHTQPVSAVSFSPDGRRLVTVSLDEGDMTVWKVGSSLSGFFTVGGPPRQGGKAGEPYRRFPIFRAGTTPMDTGALSDVQISWTGPRTARIQIKETSLSFETT